MRSMTYTADTQKIRGRFVPCVQSVVLAAVVAMVGIVFREGMAFQETFPTDNTDWFFLLASLVIFSVSVIAAFWSSRHLPTTQNLLSIDRHGLILMKRGRIQRFGHAPAFVIEDVYNTPIDDIAAVLNRYRDEGAGGGAAA